MLTERTVAIETEYVEEQDQELKTDYCNHYRYGMVVIYPLPFEVFDVDK